MSEVTQLKAEARDGVGKGASRAVRRANKVPAIIYGDKKTPLAISLPQKEVTMKLHAGGFLTHIIEIEVGGEAIRVIPKDYQLDPIKDTLMHIDFLRIAEGATLVVEVPVHFVNDEKSPGIKRGGVLNIVRHHLELIVPVDAIPESITVDLAGHDVGDSIHVSAVNLPEGVRPTISDRDFTIATIAAPAALTSEENAAGAAETTEGESEA
ncbi:LSU ribosomal protein L25P [Faunimonas pinastri]|uniref:Large ribosomal subunit protein bL25 n=1 Tax=Faunimonas pinastri TaxID=1855383 RepID=A0A1H9AFP8_9HYPH|nr:50S ribosomal protein L25/general stress protein Ctc [Faunimonas pinastri]SEP75520.1 LSU ribosomal protein L25P [Faunimonas pinastri]